METIKYTPEIIWQMIGELTASQKATEKLLNDKFQATEKILDEKFQHTQRMINQMRGHFDKQFGKLVEALIRENTIQLFIEQGINITHSKPNPQTVFQDKNMEFDLLLQNDTEIVVIEAKVSLNKQKVYHFIKKMENFKLFFKEFKNHSVYTALASVSSTSDARELAEEKGIYLLKLKNEQYMEFCNTDDFNPISY